MEYDSFAIRKIPGSDPEEFEIKLTSPNPSRGFLFSTRRGTESQMRETLTNLGQTEATIAAEFALARQKVAWRAIESTP